jgi:hypothetical protein
MVSLRQSRSAIQIKIKSLLSSGSIDINAILPREFNPPPLALAVTCRSASR